MAVLCEAISVVIKADRMLEFFGSFNDFKSVVPNDTLAADNELIRVGFMDSDDLRDFVEVLEERGMIYMDSGWARDMIVVDQLRGPAAECDWIEFGRCVIQGNEVSAAKLKGSTSTQFVAPDGWTFSDSLSEAFLVVPDPKENKSLTFLRTENGLDVFLDRLTGKEVFAGRTSKN